ncbi:DNA circularization N-terminal domain-containing protein [Escherichia coli]
MGWAENLQNASLRGVQFEVLNTDEQISRDHAVYEYPFVDGRICTTSDARRDRSGDGVPVGR